MAFATLYVGAPGTTLVDIRSLPRMVVNRLDIRAPGTRRGGPDPIPGRRGALRAELPLAEYSFSVAITLLGNNEADYEAALAAVGAQLQGTNGLLDLARHIPNGGGGYDIHTAEGMFYGANSWGLLNPVTGQTELQFVNTSGAWSPDGGSTWLLP
jgi:hypothetical protein